MLSRIVAKAERNGRPGYAVELTTAGEAMAALWRGELQMWYNMHQREEGAVFDCNSRKFLDHVVWFVDEVRKCGNC